MRISRFAILAALLCPVLGMVRANAQGTTTSESAPKLEHFDLSLVDKSLDPCEDFYQYACGKWNAANPIPADQVAWGTGSGLQYWNENILRETMEKAAAQTEPHRLRAEDWRLLGGLHGRKGSRRRTQRI